jgi:4-hydroxybenzoyl-CoA thioesterase
VSFSYARSLTIQWGDCDPAGIVHYPRYFAMFDWSTAELLGAALGIPKRAMLARYGIAGIPMVDTRAKFHAPTTFGDAVTIESRIEKVGRSSFEVTHRLLKDATLCVEGWETRVWVGRHPTDPDRIKALPIPPEVAARLA